VRVIHRMPDIVRVSRSIAAHRREERSDEVEETDDESDK
jgi:hypothetical protein